MSDLLHIDQLIVGREIQLIKPFSISLNAPNLIILSGRNGTGKSTFLKTITGLIPAIAGSTSINGITIQAKHQKTISKLVSFVNTDKVKEDYIKVIELIEFGRHPWLLSKNEQHSNQIIEEIIQLMGIDHLKYKYLNTISDGEWQKANIARAFVQNTPVVIMDEPSAFLDYPSKQQLFKDLKSIAFNKNKLIIVSTHDLDIANQYGTGFLHLENQQLQYSDKAYSW